LIVKSLIRSAWIAGALVACAVPAHAQSLGQFGGATTLPLMGRAFGTYVDASSHEVGFVSTLRLCFYPGVDFGFQGGIKRLDNLGVDRAALRLGTDFKVLAVRSGASMPVDVSIGGGLGVETGDNLSVLTIGPMAVASRAFPAGAAGAIEPYASVGISYTSIDAPGKDDTGLALPLRFGAEFRFAPDLRFVVELRQQVGTYYGDRGTFAIGTTFPF
jgi:outer membrane protein with beta-barrel domain